MKDISTRQQLYRALIYPGYSYYIQNNLCFDTLIEDYVKLAHLHPVPGTLIEPCKKPVMRSILYEEIQGERFTNIHGEEVCIGMSEQVRELIGLPLGIFDDMHGELEQHRVYSAKVSKRLHWFENMTWMDCLNYALRWRG